jgi:hypothetical protein
MKGEHLSKELGLPIEGRASWMGKSPSDLHNWTERTFEGLYEAYRDEPLHIYAPELFASSKPQANRWVERPEKLSGRYLCRLDLPFGLRRFFGVEIVTGKLTRIRSIRCGDLRRLYYGLDAIAGKSVTVDETELNGELVIVLKSELPKPELRLFAALGRLTVPEDGYYPRTWRFPIGYAPEVRSRLAALGIQISRKIVN